MIPPSNRRNITCRPNRGEQHSWVYQPSENSDLSVDAAVSDNVRDLISLFRTLRYAEAGPARL